MKKLNILILLYMFYLCSCSTDFIATGLEDINQKLYRVDDIKKENGFYYIYLNRNDSVFKVINSEPLNKEELKKYKKIKKHGRYDLTLNSYIDQAPVINGKKILEVGYVTVYEESSKSYVLVPENDIWEIYTTDDLRGLYYLK